MKIIQLGYGYWGESWLKFIADDPNAELAALCVRTVESLNKAKKDWNLPDEKCFTDIDEALKTEADVVVIVMPHYAHVEFAKKAVLSGKNVLIEKPLCDDLNEAKAFLEWMKGRPEKVYISHNYRFRKELWQMKEGFANGKLGKLQFIQTDYRAGKTTDPNEHVWNIQGWRGNQACMQTWECAVHHYDMFRFLTGCNAKTVYANAWNPAWAITKGPESYFVTIEFENGVRACFSNHMSSVGAETEFQGDWQVQGSKGLVRWLSRYEAMELYPSLDDPGEIPSVDETCFPGFDRAGVLVELRRGLAGEPVVALPTLEDNMHTLAMCEAVLLSAREGRVVRLDELGV